MLKKRNNSNNDNNNKPTRKLKILKSILMNAISQDKIKLLLNK